ncbi:MAG: hypothetical protein ACLPZM_01695 [Thermoplasmata archaeon]
MLDIADLEVNVLEFRQRSFSYDRLVPVAGEEYAVFTRTETESESQFRPRLVHLHLVVPRAWVVLDTPNDCLRVSQDGTTAPPRLIESVLEVGAEPHQFREQGIDWTRTALGTGQILYSPTDRGNHLLAAEGRAALGV